ncbi:hypothetical protein C8F01DRAFT_1179560 [Mycena amicta]|nr:hypothetical protein C8F01DRAFT_1179560 [Mycena amicta]
MSESSPKDAPAPFASTGDDSYHSTHPTDFILRSADGFDFHVHKDMLKFASGCFEGMFAVASAAGDSVSRDGKPVVRLDEPQAVLHKLLCLAYPARSHTQPRIDANQLDDFVAVYRAAHKYQFVLVEEMLKTAMDDNFDSIGSNAYRLFAIARVLGHRKLAKAAVLASLESTEDPHNLDFPEMGMISWSEGHKITHLAAEYKKKVDSALDLGNYSKHIWVSSAPGGLQKRQILIWFNGQHRGEHFLSQSMTQSCKIVDTDLGRCAEWFLDHMRKLRDGGLPLLHRNGSESSRTAIQQLSPAHRDIIESCSVCAASAEVHLGHFAAQVIAALDAVNETFEKQMDSVLA